LTGRGGTDEIKPACIRVQLDGLLDGYTIRVHNSGGAA
jgi:hypothetical protein